MVDRNEAGDETDEPLSLELIPPSKPLKKDDDEDKQPVAVGAEDSGSGDAGEDAADDGGDSSGSLD